ncbi:hypothetical protein D3C87_1957920 [compost metagenome]
MGRGQLGPDADCHQLRALLFHAGPHQQHHYPAKGGAAAVDCLLCGEIWPDDSD